MSTLNQNGDFDGRPHRSERFELIDKDGRVDSRKFTDARMLAEWAAFLWPDQEQDPDRTGRGWDIQTVGADR